MENSRQIKVSSGKHVKIRADKRVAEMFPDGCRVSAEYHTDGSLELSLRNRVGGYLFCKEGSGEYLYWTLTISPNRITGGPLPLFGSVAAEQVTEVATGLQVFLPAARPPIGKPRGRAAPKTPAPQKAAPVAKPATPPAPATEPAVATVQPLRGVESAIKPGIPLADAVAAVNGWRSYLGEKVVLELRADGGLRAYAEYE